MHLWLITHSPHWLQHRAAARFSTPDDGRKVPVQMSARENFSEPVVFLDHLLKAAGSFTCSALIDDAKAKCPWRKSIIRSTSATLPLEFPCSSKASLWWRTPAGLPRGFQQPWIVDQIWLCGAAGRGFEVCDSQSAEQSVNVWKEKMPGS